MKSVNEEVVEESVQGGCYEEDVGSRPVDSCGIVMR